MSTLTELLNDPEEHYPGNFDTPERANALLTGLCQDAATEIERLNKAVADERKWVGLTDDVLLELLTGVDEQAVRLPPGLRAFARAIEAKLREKNHD